jgi:hypothetical protein
MQTDATGIRDFLRGLTGVVHLAFEEGTQAQWLFDLTPPLVSELLVCNPRLNHSSKRANKSDRLDAFNLARDLRAGLLKGVYHGSPQTQTLKQLVHNYETLTEDTTRCMNRLKAVFRSQAVKCAGLDVYYSRNQDAWLAKLTEPGGRSRAEFLYRQLDYLRQLRREVADSKNCRSKKMNKSQPEVSKPKRGWPSKKVMAGRSGKVFSLDFLFIEQARATEAAKRVS